MIPYIIKTILCSASLYLIYYLLLEREKMYRFNRFFLLFSVVFSFTVSFITIKVAAPIMPVQESIVFTDNSLPATHTSPIYTQSETTDYLPYLLLAFYFIVSSVLFYRFIHNLTRLLAKIKGNKTVSYSGARIVLTNNNAIPFSFLNYIFINKEKFEKGAIEKEVLQHELTHVRQMHSLDVILIELFIALAWFNPLLYLFRRSILLNHEFLADESVVETFKDTKSYQLLLFEKANRKNNLILSSSFNYLITKKRLIMMTRKTSQKVAIVKQIAIIPLIAALGFLFSTKVVAQEKPNLVKQKQIEAVKTDSFQRKIELQNAKIAKTQAEKEEIRKKLESKSTDEQKVRLDKKQTSESLSEPKVKLDKEQKALLLDKQKMELDKKQVSKSRLEPKVELDKEQQAELKSQKAKLEKEMKAMTKEQKVTMKLQEAKMMEQKIKMEKELEVKMKDQKIAMKLQEAKIKEQKAKLEQEMEAKMKDQKITMKQQEAKIKEQKAKQEQK